MAKALMFCFLSLSVVALGFISMAFAPTVDYELLHVIEVDGDYMAVDQLRSAYVINSSGQVEKYDTAGTMVSRFAENRYGRPSSIDATSPFNTLIFYPDFSTVVAVDNKLNARTLYRFPSMGVNQVSAACLSHDNRVWFWDQEKSQVKKIDAQYEVVHESMEMDLVLGAAVEPNFMIERDRFLFVNDPEIGIILFDLYGHYYTSFSITGLSSFQVINENLVFLNEGNLVVYDYKLNDARELPLPNGGKNVKSVHLEKDRLFILTEKELRVYASK